MFLVYDHSELFKRCCLLCHVVIVNWFWLFSLNIFLLSFLRAPWFRYLFKFLRVLMPQILHFELILNNCHVLLELLLMWCLQATTFVFRIFIDIFVNGVIWPERTMRWDCVKPTVLRSIFPFKFMFSLIDFMTTVLRRTGSICRRHVLIILSTELLKSIHQELLIDVVRIMQVRYVTTE